MIFCTDDGCTYNLTRWIATNYRNLPFNGRATRGSRVRLPREENARSRHHRLFEKNVRKTKSGSMNFKYEKFESCFYAQGMY